MPSKPLDNLSISAPKAWSANIADGGGSLSGSQSSWVSSVVSSVSVDVPEVCCGVPPLPAELLLNRNRFQVPRLSKPTDTKKSRLIRTFICPDLWHVDVYDFVNLYLFNKFTENKISLSRVMMISSWVLIVCLDNAISTEELFSAINLASKGLVYVSWQKDRRLMWRKLSRRVKIKTSKNKRQKLRSSSFVSESVDLCSRLHRLFCIPCLRVCID